MITDKLIIKQLFNINIDSDSLDEIYKKILFFCNKKVEDKEDFENILSLNKIKTNNYIYNIKYYTVCIKIKNHRYLKNYDIRITFYDKYEFEEIDLYYEEYIVNKFNINSNRLIKLIFHPFYFEIFMNFSLDFDFDINNQLKAYLFYLINNTKKKFCFNKIKSRYDTERVIDTSVIIPKNKKSKLKKLIDNCILIASKRNHRLKIYDLTYHNFSILIKYIFKKDEDFIYDILLKKFPEDIAKYIFNFLIKEETIIFTNCDYYDNTKHKIISYFKSDKKYLEYVNNLPKCFKHIHTKKLYR